MPDPLHDCRVPHGLRGPEVPRSPVHYCRGNLQSVSLLWLTTLLLRTRPAPPTSASGIIGLEPCEVAVLCHRLVMTLRQEPGSSRTLVRSRHCLWGPLGLLPQPRDRLGSCILRTGDSGPQGEPKASRDEARKGGDVSDEL